MPFHLHSLDTIRFYVWVWDQVNGKSNPNIEEEGQANGLLPNANFHTQQEMTDKFGVGVNPWEYEVQNIQTINQFLKNSLGNRMVSRPRLDWW